MGNQSGSSSFNYNDLSKRDRERVGLLTQLYGGTPAGPSDFTAAYARDAYMPAALGAEGTGTPSPWSSSGWKAARSEDRDSLMAGLGAMGQVQQMQKAEQDRRRALTSQHPENHAPPPKDTAIPLLSDPAIDPNDPRWRYMLLLQRGMMG